MRTAMNAATLLVVLGVAVGAAGAASAASRPWWAHLAAEEPIPVHRPRDVELSSSTPVLIAKYGYPAETHTVRTDDGYLLSMHRIPNPGKPAVFLQHGILSSSADWVVLGPQKALAFLLFDAGYDVWLGNNRGNTYSRAHSTMSPNDKKFWDFSWHEMGMYDLPCMIDAVLDATGQKQLVYIAHSQGTTAFFVMASMKPEYNDKVQAFIALAPVAYLGHVKSLPLKLLAKAVNELGFIANVIGLDEFLPSNSLIRYFTTRLCADASILQPLCTNTLFLITGFDSEEFDTEKLPEIMQNDPAGASTKQLLHYAQLINSDEFRQYDRGYLGNLLHYKSLHPPDYPIAKITTRVFLHYGDNDLLAVPEAMERISARLVSAKVTVLREVPNKKFNHLDFLFARNIRPLLYDVVMDSIGEVFPTSSS